MKLNISQIATLLRPYWLQDTRRGAYAADALKNLQGNLTAYDIGDGVNGTISASSTTNMLYFVTDREFVISKVGVTCPEDGALTLTITINAVDEIVVTRSGGTWTINSENAGTNDTVLFTLSTSISVASGVIFQSVLTNTPQLSKFGYSLFGNVVVI